jgi:NOL1/NOP2/fmu family ribosome biogenesis protein
VPPGTEGLGLELTRRFYPHKCRGEGQYIALLQKTDGEETKICYRDAALPLSRDEAAAVNTFFEENFAHKPEGKAIKHGNNIVFIAHGYPLMPHSVFSAGVLIGEVQMGRLIPAHHLFSAYGKLFKRKIELSYEDAIRYIAGEELRLNTDICGWCAVTYLGATIGGAKVSQGAVKNHYPKGLRKRL